ncbi:MAG: hypothetical protein LBO07_00650 [Coriobacteriales bacterium]|nr:hypothetical protein [Coriobacteriales bacterium]
MAATVGVAAGAGAATWALSGCAPAAEEKAGGAGGALTVEEDGSGIVTLNVADEQVVVIDEFEELPASDIVTEIAHWELPMGTLVYQASREKALVLLPVDEGRELRSIGLLDVSSGGIETILEQAVGADEGAIIYDARASDEALIWVECRLATLDWQVYVAAIGGATAEGSANRGAGGGGGDGDDGDDASATAQGDASATAQDDATASAQDDATATAQEAPPAPTTTTTPAPTTATGAPIRQVDEGSADYDPPLLAISGSKAYWTVMPDANGPANQEDSFLKTVRIALADSADAPAEEPATAYVSHGRMITNPLANDGILTFVPRVDTDNIYYQLTALRVADDEIAATSVLPQALRVVDAIYLGDSFAFGIEGNYNYAGGLAWFGTYQPLPDGRWLRVSRMPVGAPVKLGSFLLVKSTINVVGIDAAKGTYFVIDVLADCAEYGDVLAGWGVQDRLLIYTGLPDRGGYGPGVAQLRVFELLPPPTEESPASPDPSEAS